jgi:hypothetical protein
LKSLSFRLIGRKRGEAPLTIALGASDFGNTYALIKTLIGQKCRRHLRVAIPDSLSVCVVILGWLSVADSIRPRLIVDGLLAGRCT